MIVVIYILVCITKNLKKQSFTLNADLPATTTPAPFTTPRTTGFRVIPPEIVPIATSIFQRL